MRNLKINFDTFLSVAIRIAFDISSGMQHMHSLTPPVIHRDLRSPNIFVLFSLFLIYYFCHSLSLPSFINLFYYYYYLFYYYYYYYYYLFYYYYYCIFYCIFIKTILFFCNIIIIIIIIIYSSILVINFIKLFLINKNTQ